MKDLRDMTIDEIKEEIEALTKEANEDTRKMEDLTTTIRVRHEARVLRMGAIHQELGERTKAIEEKNER